MAIMNDEEQWSYIPNFSNYEVSSQGRIFNIKRNSMMSTSKTNHGHPKVSLVDDDGIRHSLSLSQLVADAFVERPNMLCDQVIFLDGNLNHLYASNLAWRPRWFAWKYVRQLKETQPMHFWNLAVENIEARKDYGSIVEAGMVEGCLFEDIWRSTYTARPVFPHGSIFEVIERV